MQAPWSSPGTAGARDERLIRKARCRRGANLVVRPCCKRPGMIAQPAPQLACKHEGGLQDQQQQGRWRLHGRCRDLHQHSPSTSSMPAASPCYQTADQSFCLFRLWPTLRTRPPLQARGKAATQTCIRYVGKQHQQGSTGGSTGGSVLSAALFPTCAAVVLGRGELHSD